MNKKFLLFVMAVLCAVLCLSAYAADEVVYLDGTGATQGAYADLKSAVSALPNGGTVIVSGDTAIGTSSSGVTLAKVNGKVTITSENGAVLTLARSLTLASEIEFNNITINSAHTSNGRIIAAGNKITIGENVVTVPASNDRYPSIIGGKSSGTCTGSHVVIKSGTWFLVYGASFGGTFNGDSVVDFTGGTIKGTLIGGNRAGNFTGTATLNIGGDAVVEYGQDDENKAYVGVVATSMGLASSTTAYTFKGTATVNISDDAQIAANVLGGSRYSHITTEGDITITVGGNAKLTRNIFGGGYYGGITTGENGIRVILKDDATVGTNRYVCAGSYEDAASAIIGNGYVEFNDNAKLTGALYGGGFGKGAFNGDVEVVINGGTVTSTVSAQSRGGSVSGTQIVTLKGGSVGPVKGDATIDLAADASVTMSSCDGTITTKTVDGYEVKVDGTTYTSEKVIVAAPTTVYVDGTGKTEGAYTSFADAFNALSSEGGTVILTGDTQLGTTTSGVILGNYKEFNGKITITSENGARLIFARSLNINTDVEFENIHIHCIIPSNLTANNSILVRGNEFTVGEGVTMTKDDNAIYPTIIGGYTTNTTYDSHIVVKGGAWQNIYGGGFSGTFSGDSYVEVSNATIVGTLSVGNRTGTFAGNGTLVLDLRGNKTVSAASFDANPTILVDEGYEAVLSNGTYLQREPIVADVIYVDGTGNTEGAYTSLAEAIVAYTGGEIVVCGDTTVSGELFVPEKEKDIVISSKNGAVLTLSANVSFAKNTNDTSVIFNLPVKANDAKIFGGFRNVTFTENFSVDGKLDFFGGVDTSALTENADAITEKEYTVTVNGGIFENFALGSYRYEYKHMVGSIAATVTLNVNGGTFNSSFSVSGMAIIADNVTLNITGGTFNCPIYVRGGMGTVNTNGVKASQTVKSDRKYYAIDGDIAVNISGGTFNGGLIGAYEEQTAYTQVMRGGYTVSVTGGTFADGTVFDATQVKAYANSDKKATITYPDAYNFNVVRFDDVNGVDVTYDEPIRIAYIGDSITEGYVSKDRLTDSYPAVVDKLAAQSGTVDLVSSNYGISASGILTSASYRFTDYLGYSLILEETDADYIVIAIGTNDSPAGGTTGALNTFAENYSNLVREVGEIPTTQKVFITNALVRDNENNGQIRVTSVVRPLQERIAKEFAAQDADKYVLIDLYRLTLPYAAEDKLLSSDNLHPKTAGYALMADVLYGVIFEGEAATTDAYYSNDVYVSASGKPFASGTKSDPISRLDLAFAMLPAGEESTVHIIGKVAFAESIYTPIAPSKVTIVGEGSGAVLQNGSASFKLGSDIKFDNITLATTDSTEFYGCYYDVEMTDTVSLTGDWSFFAGHNIYAEGATNAAHDTVASASDAKDCNIILNANGTFTNFAFGNRRCVGRAPFGTYSGNLTAYIGERIAVSGTDYVGIVGQNYLTGNVTVEMPETLTLAEYAPTYTVTSPIVYDSAKNTGKVTVTKYEGTPIPTTVYVDGTGKTEGAYTSFENAFKALSSEGGTIILTGDTQLGTTSKGVVMADYNSFTGKITITSENGARLIFARSFRINCEVEFENIHIHSIIPSSLSSVNNIIACGNTITVGEGVTSSKDDGAIYPCIIGGINDKAVSYDTHVIVKGGTWQNVYGGNYNNTYSGNSTVEISNATVIGTLTAASRAGTFSGTGTLVIDLRGGKTVTAGTFGTTPTLLVDDGLEGVLVGNTYLQREPVDLTPKTVYVDGTGKTEGAYTTFAEALANMPGGGTIVVCGDIYVNSAVTLATGGELLITSVYEGKDYTDAAAIKVANDIELGCDVTFKDVVIDKAATGDDYIVANGNKLVIDEGVYCRNILATRYISIVGGAKSGTFTGNSDVTVKSGYFRNIFGGNYNGTFKGNSTVNFLGGYVDNMVAGGTFMGNFEGDATTNIGGDAVVVYSSTGSGVNGGNCGSGSEAYTFKGNIYLNVYDSARVNQNVYGTSRYSNVTTTANVYITVKDDAFMYQNLYAGGYAGTLNGNTSVIMDGGWVGVNLSAGNRGGTVNGDTYLEINGGKINYYATNLHSSYSDVPGEYNVSGGGLSGTVTGNTTVKINGGDIYGNVYGGAISTGTVGGNSTVTVTGGSIMCGIYADGATAGSVAGTKTLNVDLSKGGALAVGLSMNVNNLIGGGKLVLFPEATVTADTFSGNVELEINGIPQARNYISATNVSDATVSYTAQGSEKFVSDGTNFGISSEGYYAKTKVVYKHLNGVEIYPRAGLATDTARIAADEKNGTSTVFYLAPGIYNVVVYHTQEDYKRTYLYVKGDKEEMELDYTNYTPATFAGFEALHFYENTLEIYNTYYRTDNLVGYKTPDSPYFNNNRTGTRLFTSNDEMNAFIREKVASCDYAYAFDIFTTVGGTTVPVVIFTKDNIPADATLEDVAKIVSATKGRDIMMVVAQAHGNEPSGGEGALAMISELCGDYGNELLCDNVGAVILVPRLNPDGSEAFTRVNSNGVTVDSGKKIDNLNRDYAMLSGPEVSGTVYVFDLFAPTVFVDCHEAPLDPQWGESYTLSDIYDVGIMSSGSLNSPNVDASSVIKGNYDDRNVKNVDIITEVLGSIQTTGLRGYYYQTPSTAPCNHTPFGVINGAYGFLIEVPGISGGDAVFARRVFAQVTALKSIFNYAKNSNGEMAREVNDAREATALAAQKFDVDTSIVLQHSYTRHDNATFLWNNPLVAADATTVRADNVTKYHIQDIAMKYRARPTAYVLSKDTAGVDKVLATLDRQGIDYYALENGVTLNLKKYSGTAETATLGNAADVTFAKGAYIIPVDGYRAYFIATLFEPECPDSGEEIATFVQAGYITASDIYRSEESYIAAKLGLGGTYASVAFAEGKTIEKVIVDGVEYTSVDVEGQNAYVVASENDCYTVTFNYTDGTSENVTVGSIKGDVDGDGQINVVDVIYLIKAIVNGKYVDCDLNEDGKINLIDVIRLIKNIVM